MTREVLFRGKRVDNGKWICGYYFKIWDKTYILWGTTNDVPNMYEVIPETVGQFTGLYDKNGNKIFEGDKIRLSSEYSICGSIPREGIVMWLNDKSMYVIVQEEDINDAWHRHTELHKLPIDSYEVIGNIHDKEVAK